VWRPLRRASAWRRAREREWTTSGFLMIRPFLMSRCTDLPVAPASAQGVECALTRKRASKKKGTQRGARDARLLAPEISLVSLGSSQIFRLPHLSTLAAKRCAA
jgi:hypothetical protein